MPTSGTQTTPKKTRARKPNARSAAATRQRDWKPAFLTALARRGNVSDACKTAKIDRTTAYTHKETDADFAKLWADALDQAADNLEREAFRRAHDGVLEPVFGRDDGPNAGTVEVGKIRKYSDTLLIFLLKGIRPEKYRENVNHSGAVAVTQVTSDELAKAKAEAEAWEREKFGNGS